MKVEMEWLNFGNGSLKWRRFRVVKSLRFETDPAAVSLEWELA